MLSAQCLLSIPNFKLFLFSDWIAAGTRRTNIDFDMKYSVLQIQTDSVVGSGDVLWVRFVELNSDNGPGITVKFENPPLYEFGYCADPISFNMPDAEKNRIWTFRMENNRLQLNCNGVEILDFYFAEASRDDCRTNWSLDFAHFKFETADTASDSYRKLIEGKPFISASHVINRVYKLQVFFLCHSIHCSCVTGLF